MKENVHWFTNGRSIGIRMGYEIVRIRTITQRLHSKATLSLGRCAPPEKPSRTMKYSEAANVEQKESHDRETGEDK